MLVGENIRYIINMPRPSSPNNDTARHFREVYDRWVTSNNKTIAYILETMSDVWRTKFEAKETVVEIVDFL